MVYRVIHILILEHHYFFFYYNIAINMSQQETVTTLEQLITQMSPEGQMALAKIGVTWKDYAGYYGSLVPNDVLIRMLKQNLPWSANKITQQGQGRNGVLFTLLPMLKDQGLVEEVDGKNYTRYSLTNTGKEVMRAMLYVCTSCNQTRECSRCWQGVEFDRDENGQVQGVVCRDTKPGHDIKTCEYCNEFGHQLCYSCQGKNICQHCISDDEIG